LLGPPKSKAGRRIVGIPQAIIPALAEHLSIFVKPEPGALIFPGAQGGPLRRSNFNKMSAWPYAVRSIGAEGLHVHDLRHTGNTFAVWRGGDQGSDGADGPRQRAGGHDLPAHEARGADKTITSAIDRHVQAEQRGDDDSQAGALVPVG
jgi:integrase